MRCPSGESLPTYSVLRSRSSKPLYVLPAWGRFQVLSEAEKMARAKAEREARYWLLK